MKEIKDLLDAKKLIIGTDVIIKKLNKNALNKIFIAKNCPDKIKDELKNLTAISSIPLVEIDMNNDELGTYCRKPFHISVIAELKE